MSGFVLEPRIVEDGSWLRWLKQTPVMMFKSPLQITFIFIMILIFAKLGSLSNSHVGSTITACIAFTFMKMSPILWTRRSVDYERIPTSTVVFSAIIAAFTIDFIIFLVLIGITILLPNNSEPDMLYTVVKIFVLSGIIMSLDLIYTPFVYHILPLLPRHGSNLLSPLITKAKKQNQNELMKLNILIFLILGIGFFFNLLIFLLLFPMICLHQVVFEDIFRPNGVEEKETVLVPVINGI